MEKIDNKSLSVTLIQFLATLLIILTTNFFLKKSFLWLILAFLGLFLWLWSFVLMLKEKSYALFPQVSKNSKLVTKGPYRFIRHPIYTGIFLFSLGLLLSDFDFFRLFLFLTLLLSTILKLNLEEKYLIKHFKNYLEYQKNTWRLIPFIY